jgi:hypothetical protein
MIDADRSADHGLAFWSAAFSEAPSVSAWLENTRRTGGDGGKAAPSDEIAL